MSVAFFFDISLGFVRIHVASSSIFSLHITSNKSLQSHLPTPPSFNRLPFMAKKLEEHLYRSAQTKDEYIDQNTLKKRLQMIAHGLGVPKSGGGGGGQSLGLDSIGGDSSNQAAASSAASGQNDQIAQLKAMQAQAQAASGGSTDDAQSSQAQHQLNLLKQQQQQQQLGIMAAMIQQSGQDGSINKEALLQQLQQQQVSSIDYPSPYTILWY